LWAIQIDPKNNQHIYVGQFVIIDKRFNKSTVYHTEDGGKNWMPIGELKDGMIWDMQLLKDKLYAVGQHGVYCYQF
jgi:photosystem II stability/assembly factor-like uncharacterized protein